MHNRRPSRLTRRHASLATSIAITSLALGSLSAAAVADTPAGWISADNYGAYTLGTLDFELHLGGIAMNDGLDFSDSRYDILSNASLLEGEDRDLAGSVIDFQLGLTSFLTAFYRRQDSDLSIDFSYTPSVGLVTIDDELQTESDTYGLKWNIYESGRSRSNAWTATSLELSFSEGSSDDFSGSYNGMTIQGQYTPFGTDATFTLQDLEDEAWKVRLIHTAPISRSITGTVWGGYSETEATASTSLSAVNLLAPTLVQGFKTETSQYTLGGSLNWQITPRMPLQLSYEYIKVQDRDDIMQVDPVLDPYLPDFLQAGNVGGDVENENHIISANLSYWITRNITVSITGKVFSNQFLGVTPHYHNPLTAAFAQESYSYAGLHLGIKL